MEHNERVLTEKTFKGRKARKGLGFAVGITSLILIVELIGGWLSGSLALVADAGHMATDLFALLISFIAVYISSRPSTQERSYGYVRIEILAALINGIILCVMAVFVLIEAFRRISLPADIQSTTMLVFGLIGLAANIASAFMLHREQKNSVNVKAAYIHVLSDLAGSVGVVAGALLITLTGLTFIDSFISFLIALLIIHSAVKILRESVNVLMESVPEELDIDEIEKTLLHFNHVHDLHDLHVWALTSGVYALSCHLVVDDPADNCSLLACIHRKMKELYNIDHVTIQLEARKTSAEQPEHPCHNC
ncbi:cation transporter [Prosthecochloris sp. N3]|uniref:Cation transporter n=1 Tax=Prosthecochloris ethylica TaxID=2743976 RepID=A0ABR9XRU3_9CHLB|nr:cation diffusion facilitator family transporter [Prosthecochloris ethylica]MBF0586738.1 cation transporter [Prosthecochloris ethylica]MBF0636644.1 cation transporter [Prosthecochloris ethylica]MEC9487458.1 cation diffusion facilitator family transporter [Prosthecochloris sp.]NUK47957.1 cation transporter [Prosthecochloris ethylica]